MANPSRKKTPALPPSRPPAHMGSGTPGPAGEPGFLPEDPKDRILIWVSVTGLLVVFYLLFFWDNYAGVKDAKVVGVLRTDRSVRRRHSRTLHWHDLKRQDTVYFQDIVYTPKDTQAVVTFADGRTLDLKPDSMVQFDELTVDGIQITLFDLPEKMKQQREFFRLVPFPKVVKTNLLADPSALELRQGEFSDRVRKHFARPLNLSRLARIDRVPFSLNRMTDYQIRLLRPENKVFDMRSNRWIQHIWTPLPVDGVKYEIQVSVEPSFGRYLTHKAKKYQLLIQYEKAAKYFWRVKGHKEDDFVYSKVGSFTFSETRGEKKRYMLNEGGK